MGDTNPFKKFIFILHYMERTRSTPKKQLGKTKNKHSRPHQLE